jgi:hypothetical protein
MGESPGLSLRCIAIAPLGLPLIVYSDRKQTYLQALEAADKGRVQMFVDYLSGRMIETAARAQQELTSLASPSVEDALTGLMDVISSHPSITIVDVRQVAIGLLQHVQVKITPLDRT